MSRLPTNYQKGFNVIVAADTVVSIDGDVLGKPGSAEVARRMLHRLSGRWHEVFTGLAVQVRGTQRPIVVVEKTRVEFAALPAREIEEYVQSNEPLDKAGAYAIQSGAGKFISRIDGCYFNVVGLPLARLHAILRELNLD